MIGCRCAVCASDDPRDRRSRPSVLVEPADGVRVLIDTSTDLRVQALGMGLDRIDLLLYTHGHADHIFGFDDLRRFNVGEKTPLQAYADAQTVADLRQVFAYAFASPVAAGGGVPRVTLSTLAGPFSFGGQMVVPVPVLHGTRLILGYRFGRLAYLTDCSAIPDGSWTLLEGVEALVIDALRWRPHPTHFSIDEAIAAARRIGASRTWFTHMCHDLGHAETSTRLPDGFELAYDGLVVSADD